MDANDRRLVEFTSIAHALFHTYELSIPLFIGFWLADFGMSAAVVGLVVGVGYGLVGLGAPPSGLLADRFRSRLLILISVVGMGAGFALVSLARGPVTLAAALVLWGIFASIYHPAGLSLISRAARARGTVFAYHGAGGNVGTAAGPLMTALLLLWLDWRLAAGLLAIPAVVAAAVGLRIEFDSHRVDGPRGSDDAVVAIGNGSTQSAMAEFRQTIADSRMLFGVGFSIAFVAVLLYGTYYRGLLTFLPDVLGEAPHLTPFELFDRQVDPAQYVYTALLTLGIAGQYVGGRLTDRIRSETAFLGALGGLVALALLFPIAKLAGIVPLLVVSLALGFFVYGTAPIYQVVIAEYADDAFHGLSYGFTYLAMFGIGALGASLAGFVLTHWNSTILFTTLAGIATLASLFVLVLRLK